MNDIFWGCTFWSEIECNILLFSKGFFNSFFHSSIPIDYNLYRKFWSLQDYFRNPVQCYEKVSWKTFLKVI